MAGTAHVEEPAIARTDAAVPVDRLQRDVARVLEGVYGGGVAIIPLDVAYAIIGHRPAAIRDIFDAKQRSYEKPSGMFGNWRMSRDIHLLPDEKHDMVRTIIDFRDFTVVRVGVCFDRLQAAFETRFGVTLTQ